MDYRITVSARITDYPAPVIRAAPLTSVRTMDSMDSPIHLHPPRGLLDCHIVITIHSTHTAYLSIHVYYVKCING